ncbi:MAG TPA: hypothetical protein VNT51_08475 [Miltoncostaeaceae bacterium]|jgi:hypothetical protein|nr:hypothetical protein [Miltoncostaeaceae bacterium]
MAIVSSERLADCSTWLSCGPVEPGMGVLFRFPFELAIDQFEAVADAADRLVAHLREDGEFGGPRDDLFWISHEELVGEPLNEFAEALGSVLGLPPRSVTPLLVREVGEDWLDVEAATY